jgi:o-succinylbenzoate synthase
VAGFPQLDGVEAIHVRVPFKRPFTTAHGVFAARSSWIVLLRDLDGREGFGEIALEPWASAADELALGRGVREVVDLLTEDRVPEWAAGGSHGQMKRAVRAGVEEAVEGLAGHQAVDSICVAVNATLDFSSPAEAAAAAVEAVAAGFTTLKVKVVGDESVDALVVRVTAIREAVGPEIRLRLDANGSWSFDTALARLGALRTLNVEYVEQPLPAADLDGHAALREVSAVPIALDESVEDEASARRILELGAAAVLVIKPARVGGPAVARAIAALAADAGVPVIVSTFFETGVGIAAAVRLAASLPRVGEERAHGLATAGLLENDLLATPMAVSGGRISLPPVLALDDAALNRCAVERIGQA